MSGEKRTAWAIPDIGVNRVVDLSESSGLLDPLAMARQAQDESDDA